MTIWEMRADNWKVAVLQLAKTNIRQEFGELTLDESLVARERISLNLQTSLDQLTTDWGLKVCKVEIRLIYPPSDIKKAMHKQLPHAHFPALRAAQGLTLCEAPFVAPASGKRSREGACEFL